MKNSIVYFLLHLVYLVYALDDHTYKIRSVATGTTIRADRDTDNLTVSDVLYPGWSEFFYLLNDIETDTFALANFAYERSFAKCPDEHNQPCFITDDTAGHFWARPVQNSNNNYTFIIVNQDGSVWSVDEPNSAFQSNIVTEEINYQPRQAFIFEKWE